MSANPTAGFSIVSWSSPVSGGSTIGHGLSSTPELLILKSRSESSAWGVFVPSILGDKYLYLNGTTSYTDANYTPTLSSTTMTAPSSLYYFGSPSNSGNNLCYAFHSVEGYSKIGSYTGNGSTDGTFVYTGFKPAFVIARMSSGTGSDWSIYDYARSSNNPNSNTLASNTSNDEETSRDMDFLSNGFKLRVGGGSNPNVISENYIYMAFAEKPFGNVNGTAR